MSTCGFFASVVLLVSTQGYVLRQSPESQPNDKMSDWYRCHGLPCSDWDEVERMMAAINVNVSYDLTGIPNAANLEEATDIWLTPDQAQNILKEELSARRNIRRKRSISEPQLLRLLRSKKWNQLLDETARSRVKRKIEAFDVYPERQWSNPIVYKFDGGHNLADKGKVRGALDHWMQQTCLQFFEVNDGAPISDPHLKITNQGYRCASFVGRVNMTRGSPQQINLPSSCLYKFGIAVHEIGHALGLWHEQQRSDRDTYITIVDKNVDFWARPNFNPAPENYLNHYGVPYDYNSVMHYGPTVGSMTGRQTIVTKDPLYTKNIGQRVGLSFIDAKVINMAYCADYCRSPLEYECLHGGYQDPNNCDRCRCPDGLGGPRCEDVAPSVRTYCGGTIELGAGSRLQISSPGYSLDMPYPDRVECNWLIKAPEKHTMSLHFEDDFDIFCISEVCYHWVEVRREHDMGKPGPRFCGSGTPRDILVSEGNTMLVTFRSNYTIYNQYTGYRGFKAVILSSEDKEMPNVIPPVVSPELPDAGVLDTGSGEVPIELEPQISWGDWSPCVGHPCACGGCSSRTRQRLCDGSRCEGDLEAEEEEYCGRPCTDSDKMFFYAGRIYRVQCPVCCNGHDLQENSNCTIVDATIEGDEPP